MGFRIPSPDVFLVVSRAVVMHSVDVSQLSRSDLLRLWDPVLQHISDGVVVTDARRPDQPILLVNRAFEHLTGYSADEVLGRNCRFLQGEDRAQPAIVPLREAIREQREARVVLRNYRKDGELFWNEMTLVPVRDEEDSVAFFVGVLRDVTQLRQAEEERRNQQVLRDSEQRLRQIAEQLDDAVWLLESESGHPLYSNAAYGRIWGPAVAPGSDAWLEAIHPKDRRRARALVFPGDDGAENEPSAAGRVEVELRVSDAGGTERWMRGRSFPIVDDRQRVVRRVGIIQDVTEHRRIQEQLRRTNDALATTVQELARRNLQMLALNETVDHLQGCANWQEAKSTLEECVPEIFPQEAGGLYLMNPERTALEPLVIWGAPAPPDRSFPPDDCQAIRRRREFWTDSSHPSARCRHYEPHPGAADLCLSLRTQSLALGLLHLRVAVGGGSGDDAGQDLKAGVLRFAVNAAEQIALTLANIQLRQTLHTQAIQDPLTGLYNRRFFTDALERELRRSARRDTPMSLLMIDLDHFKRVNDESGHEAGDRMLQAVAEMLRGEVRAEDVIARYGGEEFMVLLPETDLVSAKVLAERLRQAFKHLEVHHRGRSLGHLTLSVGVAARSPRTTTGEHIVEAADAALYRAKREGRDRVVTADVD